MTQTKRIRNKSNGNVFIVEFDDELQRILTEDGKEIPPDKEIYAVLRNGDKKGRFEPLEQQHAST